MEFSPLMVTLPILDFHIQCLYNISGSDVLAMSQEDPEFRNDALNNVFPKVTYSYTVVR